MEIPKTLELHLNTAKSLILGIEESISVIKKAAADSESYMPNVPDVPKEHSKESIDRRLIQARQELLVVSKIFDKLYGW